MKIYISVLIFKSFMFIYKYYLLKVIKVNVIFVLCSYFLRNRSIGLVMIKIIIVIYI